MTRRKGGGDPDDRPPGPAPVVSVRPAVPSSPASALRGVTAKSAVHQTHDVLADTDDGTSHKERAERPPASWDHFAPPPDRSPSAARRLVARADVARRFLSHEWTLAVLGGIVLSVLLNLALPMALHGGEFADPRRTLPQDVWDPSLVTYLIAWGGHALTHDPSNLWHLNGFFPSPYGLAYTDSLLGYAPLAIVGTGPELAVLRYNIIYVLAQALVFIGAYALARQIGAERIGAVVAGVAFAVAPWRLAQAGHLQVISTGGMVLALAMLARGHGIRWTRRGGPTQPQRPGWALAGWLVATWQISIGFGTGIVFAYVLLGVFVTGSVWWLIRRRSVLPLRLIAADGVGGLIFVAVALLMARPYLAVLRLYPYARRDAAWIELYSPPPRGLLTAPAESLLWGGAHAGARAGLTVPGEMALLPGFALCALAVAGLFFSVWRPSIRVALGAAAAVSAVLALGTNGPAQGHAGYLALLHLPGFEGLRTPGRLIIWTTAALGLLAAGGVAALVGRGAAVAERLGLPKPSTAARLALLLPAVLVLFEGLGTTPHASVPPPPPALSTVAAPYLVLPTDQVRDMHVLLWSTDRFAKTVNGGSGVVPTEQQRVRDRVARFPDAASVAYLRQIGVRSVVVLKDRAAGTAWADAEQLPIDALGITREVTADAVVFHLTP